jgi:DNA polymerase-3 subunit alpha
MNELYKELLKYLDDNFIEYKELGDFILEINNQTFELFEPVKWDENDSILFDEDFRWAGDKTDCDNYIFLFGSVWWYLKKGNEISVKLEKVKWLGKANLEDESFYVDAYLGIHGTFELMNSVGLYDEWCKKAKFLKITSLGLCEKNTLAGSMKFQKACQKAGLRSIQGMEITVFNEKKDLKYTIKAFVKDKTGWQNLLQLNEIINTNDNAFVTEEDLENYYDGLIFIWDPKTIEYRNIPSTLKEIAFYYQLDTVVFEKEEKDKNYLDNLKRFFLSELEPVAMCDAYYIEKEWLPIKKKLNTLGKIVVHESENQYFKNYQEYFEELSYLFGNDEKFFETFEKALQNLKDISFECNFVIETQIRHMPIYYMTDEEALQYENNKEMFRDLIFKGIEEHPDLLEKYSDEEIGERIDRELKVIEDGEVVDYFLMLRDIINWCKKEKILLGSGRGCFIPKSKVKTKSGWKFIEDIQVGDIVQGECGWNEVEDKFVYDVNEELVILELDDNRKITCTKDHRILTKNRGYVKAIDITDTDILSEVFED